MPLPFLLIRCLFWLQFPIISIHYVCTTLFFILNFEYFFYMFFISSVLWVRSEHSSVLRNMGYDRERTRWRTTRAIALPSLWRHHWRCSAMFYSFFSISILIRRFAISHAFLCSTCLPFLPSLFSLPVSLSFRPLPSNLNLHFDSPYSISESYQSLKLLIVVFNVIYDNGSGIY